MERPPGRAKAGVLRLMFQLRNETKPPREHGAAPFYGAGGWVVRRMACPQRAGRLMARQKRPARQAFAGVTPVLA